MSTINLQQITLESALADPDPLSFDPPPRAAALTIRRTCVVCDKPAEIPILAAGLLCDHCRRDLDATERHIRETLAAAEQAFDDATTCWDAVWGQADSNDQARYFNVCEAHAANAPGFAEKYKRALERDDGLSALLKAKAACDDVAARVQGRLAVWAEQCLEEVREARP